MLTPVFVLAQSQRVARICCFVHADLAADTVSACKEQRINLDSNRTVLYSPVNLMIGPSVVNIQNLKMAW